MQLTNKSTAIFTILGIATAGTVAALHFTEPARSIFLKQGPSIAESGWQSVPPMSMSPQTMPGHRGMMMPMMHATSEFEFLSLMIPHHQEAITTAQEVLARSDRPEMREFAQNIIAVQSAEIDQMQTWLGAWYPDQATDLTYVPMMRDLTQLEGEALDQAFLEDMIMHHRGAVMMSHQLLHHGLVEHSAVQPFAENIAETQWQEIGQMQSWLQNWFGTRGMPGPMHHGPHR